MVGEEGEVEVEEAVEVAMTLVEGEDFKPPLKAQKVNWVIWT